MNKMRFPGLSRVLPTSNVWIRTKEIVTAVLSAIALIALAGFAGGSADEDRETDRGASKAAIERFWSVYHGNEYSAIPQVQAQLQNALQRDSGNSTLYALLGATYFWHYGEYTRDPNLNLGILQQDLPNAVSFFGKALELDYYGKHLIGYINDDHLPGYLGITTVHLGQRSGDPDLIAKGDQMLDLAAYQFPEFNNFNRWAAHNTEHRDSDSYKKALNSLWQAPGRLRRNYGRSFKPGFEAVSLSSDPNRTQESLLVGGRYRAPQLRRLHVQSRQWPGQGRAGRGRQSHVRERQIRRQLLDLALSEISGRGSQL